MPATGKKTTSSPSVKDSFHENSSSNNMNNANLDNDDNVIEESTQSILLSPTNTKNKKHVSSKTPKSKTKSQSASVTLETTTPPPTTTTPTTTSTTSKKRTSVHWGHVFCREFKRLVGGSGGFPDHSEPDWALGLSDTIIGRTRDGSFQSLTRDYPGSNYLDIMNQNLSDSDDEHSGRGTNYVKKNNGTKRSHSSPKFGASSSSSSSPRLHPKSPSSVSSTRSPTTLSPTTTNLPSPTTLNSSSPLTVIEELTLTSSAIPIIDTVLRRQATTIGIQSLGSVDEVEKNREDMLNERMKALPEKERKLCTGETRQWSKGGIKNPLFRYLTPAARFELFLRDTDDVHSPHTQHRNNHNIHTIKNIIESRARAGCSCKDLHDTSMLKKASREKLVTEAEARKIPGVAGWTAADLRKLILAHDTTLPFEETAACGHHDHTQHSHAESPKKSENMNNKQNAPTEFPVVDSVLAVKRAQRLYEELLVDNTSNHEIIGETLQQYNSTCPCVLLGLGCMKANNVCRCASSCINQEDILDITVYSFPEAAVGAFQTELLNKVNALGKATRTNVTTPRYWLSEVEAVEVRAAAQSLLERIAAKNAAKAQKEAAKAQKEAAKAALLAKKASQVDAVSTPSENNVPVVIKEDVNATLTNTSVAVESNNVASFSSESVHPSVLDVDDQLDLLQKQTKDDALYAAALEKEFIGVNAGEANDHEQLQMKAVEEENVEKIPFTNTVSDSKPHTPIKTPFGQAKKKKPYTKSSSKASVSKLQNIHSPPLAPSFNSDVETSPSLQKNESTPISPTTSEIDDNIHAAIIENSPADTRLRTNTRYRTRINTQLKSRVGEVYRNDTGLPVDFSKMKVSAQNESPQKQESVSSSTMNTDPHMTKVTSPTHFHVPPVRHVFSPRQQPSISTEINVSPMATNLEESRKTIFHQKNDAISSTNVSQLEEISKSIDSSKENSRRVNRLSMQREDKSTPKSNTTSSKTVKSSTSLDPLEAAIASKIIPFSPTTSDIVTTSTPSKSKALYRNSPYRKKKSPVDVEKSE